MLLILVMNHKISSFDLFCDEVKEKIIVEINEADRFNFGRYYS